MIQIQTIQTTAPQIAQNAPAPAHIVESTPAPTENRIYAVVAETQEHGAFIDSFHKTQEGAFDARRAVAAQYESVSAVVIVLVGKQSRRGDWFVTSYYDADGDVVLIGAHDSPAEAASFPFPCEGRYSIKTFKAHLSI